MKTYTTTKVMFAELEKKLARLFKKMDVIGATYTFNKIRDFVKEVPVYTIDPITQSKHHTDDVRVECVEFELDFDTYKVGDYRVSALVERTEEDDNLVYAVEEDFDFTKYAKAELRCDHCRTKHSRRKVAIVTNNQTGEELMIGKACLKDFTGINTYNYASLLYGAEEILYGMEDQLGIIDTDMKLYTRIIDTFDYLTACISIAYNKGYYKNLKSDAMDLLKKNTIFDDKYREIVKTVTEFFETYETTDCFEHDTRIFVTGRKPIACENGFIAYAYTLYKKIIERIESEKARAAAKEKSNFVGNVGEKIEFTADWRIAGGYETQFGYITIYKFTDADGNIFVWKTSTGFIDPDKFDGRKITIKGTIKDHNEYNDEKQTVLIRCKVCAVA